MRRDLARLRSLIPASEKDKLDAYASAISQLEASLRAKYGDTGGACVTPPTRRAFPLPAPASSAAGTVSTVCPASTTTWPASPPTIHTRIWA